MTIYVVTDSKIVRKAFSAAERSRTYTVEFAPASDLADVIKRSSAVPDSFLYVDADGVDASHLKRRVTSLRNSRPYRYGIIDANHSLLDVAELFHNAAADYVGRNLLARGISTARLRRVVEYNPAPQRRSSNHVPEHEHRKLIPSGADWSSVTDGEEYTFIMLFAAIDQAGDWRRKSSESFLASMRKGFIGLLERSFADLDARQWMWKEDEGLLLMPFDGRDIGAVIPALRLMLNRDLINVEEFGAFGELSFRLALHLGNTIYRSSGMTGNIVSESVNFLFHLGARFVDQGGLAMTAPCLDYVPERVRPLFDHRGSFESIHVYALRELA